MIFSKSNIGYVGVDIGKTSVKLVELKKHKGEIRLLTYGYSEFSDAKSKVKEALESNDVAASANILKKIYKEAGVRSHNAIAALPSYAVFSSVISLPPVSGKDLTSAINFEAKKIIPLPIDEMALDWKDFGKADEKGFKNYLLTGAPRKLVKKYIEIFRQAELNLLSLETETFSLIRSLAGEDKSIVVLLEIGGQTTNISIIESGIPVLNRNLDIGGETITRAIGSTLNIGLERAEQFKYDLGMNSFNSRENIVPKTISDVVAPIVNEIKYVINIFQSKNNREQIEKVILSGGSSLLPNLDEYFSQILNMKVIIANPWNRVSYPIDLKPMLDEIGPKLAVATGLAMREIE